MKNTSAHVALIPKVLMATTLILAILAGCRMSGLMGGGSAAEPILPADQIADVARGGSEEFSYDTLLPVTLQLQADLYSWERPADGPFQLQGVAREGAAVIVTLQDAEGRELYTGKLDAAGALSARLQLPAAVSPVTLTLSGDGLQERKLVIRDMQRYSLVKRRMSMMAEGVQAKGDGLTDTDSDGVPDIYDVAPQDPSYAFSRTVPADGWLSIAFEDLFGLADAGDADYNDFVGRYRIVVKSNGENKVTAYEVEAWADAKIAGYNHLFGMLVDSFAGNASLTVRYYDRQGALRASVVDLPARAPANVVLFPSTKDMVGFHTSFTLEFDEPQEAEGLSQPPLNPYLYVFNTRHDIHMIGKPALPLSINPGDLFRDAKGFPWALLVPTLDGVDGGTWKHPAETQRIEIPYPRFTLWRESLGDTHVDWYLHYYDPYVPPTEPVLERAADINPGAGGSSPANPAVYGGALYFAANDGASGTELWRWNGAAAVRVADLAAGSSGSDPAYLTVYGARLYFKAKPASTELLYRYDGSSAAQISGLDYPAHLALFGSNLYLQGRAANGFELLNFNGTTVTEVADIYSGVGSSLPAYLTALGGKLYFAATEPAFGRELWAYDGLAAPVRASDINPGAGASNPTYLTAFGSTLVFQANDGAGTELWSHDGTAVAKSSAFGATGGSVPLSPMAVYDGRLYFAANDGATGLELWCYDGSSVSQVKDLNPGAASGLAAPTYFAVYDGRLYFAGNDGSTGLELYSFDGQGVSLVGDINPGVGGSSPAHLLVYDDTLYFAANDGASGAELWMYRD